MSGSLELLAVVVNIIIKNHIHVGKFSLLCLFEQYDFILVVQRKHNILFCFKLMQNGLLVLNG